ncbi:MAG: glycerol kinase GlpK [Pseudomonadota bacterium]
MAQGTAAGVREQDLILALDQGTSSSRALLFDAQGQLLGLGQQDFDMTFPEDGWVEQDPEVLWATTLAAGRAAISRAAVAPERIAAIGITNQRETTLLWDAATRQALHPAIVWQDRRTATFCADLKAGGHEPMLAERTGLRFDPYFSGTKLRWLLETVPQARARAARGELRAGTVDTFLIDRLTKGECFVTDATNASRTLLYNPVAQHWDPELCALLDVPESLLPEVLDCAADFGVADPEWFGAPIPIRGVAGDQHAALIGQACLEPGMSKCTFGTGCFALTNLGGTFQPSQQGLLATLAYQLDGEPTFALEGSVFVAGVAVKWLRDKLGLIADAGDTEAAALRTSGDTGGVVVVPAFTGLGAPYWDPDARGLIAGLTLDTTADQLVTATLKAVAFQAADLTGAMAADGAPLAQLRVDGGMVVNDWFCQQLAELTGLPVVRPKMIETTALGAAMLAAVGQGLFSNLDAAREMWQQETRFEPSMSTAQRAAELERWATAVQRARSGL